MNIANIFQSKKIYHIAKKQILCARKMNNFLTTNPNVSRHLGALPFDWYSCVDKSERANATMAVYDCLKRFAFRTKDVDDMVWPTRRFYLDFEARKKAFQEDYTILKDDLSKILNRDDIELDYVGTGVFKSCTKLKVGEYEYALSTFKDKGCFGEYKNYFIFAHGRGMEPQHVFINYKRSSHGRFAKPFMSNVCGKDDFDGFILSKFINKDKNKGKKEGVFVQARGFFSDVDPHNICNGISIESGGRFYNSTYIENPHVRNTWSRFANILDGNIDDLKGKRWIRPVVVQKFLLDKAKSGVDICSDTFRENFIKELIPFYLRDEVYSSSRYNMKERFFIHVLSFLPVDSYGYKFMLNNIGTHMPAGSGIRYGFKNFSEVVKNMLKLVNRKAAKQIRAVKKVRALKNDLSAKGEYVKYRAMLRADVNRLFLGSNDLPMLSPKYYPELLDYELGLNKSEEVFRERDF